MSTLAAAAPRDRLAFGMVLACAMMVAMGFGAVVNIAVFLTPLGAEFGWSRAELSLAYSVASVCTGLGSVVMGHFSDRLPIRRIVMCGALVPGITFMLMSRLESLPQLYFAHAIIGLLGIGALFTPLNSLAACWFPDKPGMAIGLVSAGGALGQGLMPFLARNLVLLEGWRQAYLLMGVLYLVLMLPLALWIRNPPAARAALQGAQPPKGYAVPRIQLLAWLCVAVVLCCICMATPIIHVAALGADMGLSPRESAGLLTTAMGFGMLGRIAFGRLADRLGNIQAYIGASVGQTALVFLFPMAQSRLELYLLAAAFGLVFSGAMTAFILCAREYAPPGRQGLSIGAVSFFGWAGMALGGWQGGLFYDLCGSYGQSFANGSLGGVANIMVLGLLYVYTVPSASRALRTFLSKPGWLRGRSH